jgi:protein required for attachment to host cells
MHREETSRKGRFSVSTTWIVVADRCRCSIYRRQRGVGLDAIAQLEHPEGRMANRAPAPDSAGRGGDARAQGDFEKHYALHDQEGHLFAKEIAAQLASARNAHRFDSLVLVAEPHFLGMLHEALDTPTRALVRGEVRKHLVDAPLPELTKQVPAVLA